MDEWMQAQLAAGLPAFRGSTIAGTIALNQDLLNELVGQWLAAAGKRTGGSAGGPELTQLLPFLKQALIRAETGTVLVDFQIVV
jgi:hypothetical protein